MYFLLLIIWLILLTLSNTKYESSTRLTILQSIQAQSLLIFFSLFSFASLDGKPNSSVSLSISIILIIGCLLYLSFFIDYGFNPIRNFYEVQKILSQKKSVDFSLYFKIFTFSAAKDTILSMHNQECSAEDDLYLSGTGEIYHHLTQNLGLDLSAFRPSGCSALESVIGWLPTENNLLLVHNIRTRQKDIDLIGQARSLTKTWFVICPRSNLFIEDRLPDIELFRKNNLQICIGTDGLSSNKKLSVLEEMKTIQTHFPDIPFPEIVTWATRNGAEALSMNKWAGTIEIGKRPGLNLITGMDLQHLRLQPQSKVKRLI